MENRNKKLENNATDTINQKEEKDKKLLRLEIIISLLCVLPLLIAVVLVSLIPMEELLDNIIVGISVLPILIAAPFMIKIEQKAGYYKCKHCGYTYVPKYSSVFFAPHFGRTRYMKCPKCNKESWHKKVLRKED